MLGPVVRCVGRSAFRIIGRSLFKSLLRHFFFYFFSFFLYYSNVFPTMIVIAKNTIRPLAFVGVVYANVAIYSGVDSINQLV